MNPLDWSLTGGVVPVVLLMAGLITLALLVAGGVAGGKRAMRWWGFWLPAIVLVTAGLTVLLAGLIGDVWRPFAEPLPTSVVVWSWVGVTGVVLALARQPFLRSWPGHVGAILAGVLVLLAAGNQINQYYQQYPTLRIALGPWLEKKPVFTSDNPDAPEVIPGPGEVLAAIWHPPANMPKTGQVYQVTIPGQVSRFPARPGYLYLPPAYLSSPRAQLPVLVLLAGQPGEPRQWVDSGEIQAMMDDFAAQHLGLAPVVVMPDDLGSELANPLCVDSKLGNAQTYLTADVPAWITRNLRVRPPDRGWAIAGFSHGGTCSIQLTTQAPKLYPDFIDISGQDAPTLGTRQLTIDKAFGGNAAAYAKVNPIDVMAHTQFPDNAGLFAGGADDHEYTPQQRVMYQAAKRAGMDVQLEILPGGHSWQVWRAGLQRNLTWLAQRTGII
jgi:S-formylglutathione hydrolase FrmB